MDTTTRCPHCGATLPEGSLFCYKCGTKIETPTDIPDYSDLIQNSSANVQDKNIPIDELIGQTTVMNNLMSELDDLVKGDGPDIPAAPITQINVKKESVTSAPSTPVENTPNNQNEKTDLFSWEIPSFNTSTNPTVEDDVETPTSGEPTLKEEYQEETDDKPVLSRSARHKHYNTDPYENENSEDEDTEENHTVPPIKKETKKKKKSFFFVDEDDDDDEEEEDYNSKSYDDDDEDFEDEYAEHHIWPIVLGVILLLIVVGTVCIVKFKPDIANKGIDAINNLVGSEIKHIGATEEPVATIEVVTPTPEAIDTTVYDAEHAYFSTIAHNYVEFYKEYIDAYNSGDIQSLNHVTDSLKAEIQDRYTQYNSGLGFESLYTYIDLDTYVISELQDDGYYNVSFNAYQENKCWNKETNEEQSNNPTMSISIRYNSETGDYYLNQMLIDNTIVLGNNVVDVTEW